MTGTTCDILSIVMKSNYYRNNVSKDFVITPDKDTENFLKSHSISFSKNEKGYRLSWLVKNIDDFKKCYKTVFSDVTLNFDINIKNKKAYKYLNVDDDKLYLYEKGENDNEFKIDTVLKFDYDSNLNENSFGKIKMNIANLDLDKNNVFILNFDCLKSYWNIKINKKKTSINNILGIFINNTKYDFLKVEKNSFIYYVSKEPIDLHESGFYKLNIEYLTNRDNVEVENLIPPTHYNRIDKNNFISEINCEF